MHQATQNNFQYIIQKYQDKNMITHNTKENDKFLMKLNGKIIEKVIKT